MRQTSLSSSRVARRVLRLAASGALATLNAKGGPFASLVTVATTPAGAPILLLSRLAVHTQNLAREARASLLLTGAIGENGDSLAAARLTLVGRINGPHDDPVLRQRFLARHAEAASYAGFTDFGFNLFDVEGGHLVAGFGRIAELTPDDILTDVSDAAELIAGEPSAIDHMNAEHAEALRLYATRSLGLADGDWRMTGADPDGIDLRAGAMRGRLEFGERVTSAAGLRQTLADLAQTARGR